MHLSKTKAAPLANRFAREKRLEHVGQKISRNPGAGILDVYTDIISGRIGRVAQLFGGHSPIMAGERYVAAFRHRVARIQYEVQDRRVELAWVDATIPKILVRQQTNLHGFAGC